MCESLAVPGAAVTCGDSFRCRAAAVDSEVERHRAVATCGVGIDMRWCIRTICVGRVPPSVAVASSDRLNTRIA